MLFESVINRFKKFKKSGREIDKDSFKYAKLPFKKISGNKKILYFEEKIAEIKTILKNSGELWNL